MDEKTIEVSKEELAATLQTTAVFSNKFYVSVRDMVRISFAEQLGAETTPHVHTAVAMTHSDAIQLAKLLESLLADVERQINAAAAAAARANETGPQNG